MILVQSRAVRDLRVYADAHECDVYHHRLDSGLEADAIIRRRYTGEWIAVEMKLSYSTDTIEAWRWLDAARQREPQLFAHWHLLASTQRRTAGAV